MFLLSTFFLGKLGIGFRFAVEAILRLSVDPDDLPTVCAFNFSQKVSVSFCSSQKVTHGLGAWAKAVLDHLCYLRGNIEFKYLNIFFLLANVEDISCTQFIKSSTVATACKSASDIHNSVGVPCVVHWQTRH